MAELKRFEYIIEFEPVGAVNGKGEVCFQAKGDRMTRLVRCADCKWMQCNMRQDGYLPQGVSEFECRKWCYPNDPTGYCSWAKANDH